MAKIGPCTCELYHQDDPDCELHHPEVIEDDDQREHYLRYFYAGAMDMMQTIQVVIDEVFDKSLESFREEHKEG